MTTARMTRTDVAEVEVPVGRDLLTGVLSMPAEVHGVVVFAHGSGSGRASPRNRAVAGTLVRDGVGTLLVDLLTADEAAIDAETGIHRVNVPLLSRRVIGAVDWLANRADDLPLGCFGSSIGAAAALVAASERPATVRALVARGGRVDLAGDAVVNVRAPALLIVGSLDTDVIRLNHLVQGRLCRPCRLEIIPGAGHLFEEPGTLERVAHLTRDWFRQHLVAG